MVPSLLLWFSVMGCASLNPQPQITVRGELQYFPSDVRTEQAWYGHNFMVDQTPVIPTDAVPEDVLKQHIGQLVVVEGVWNPGKIWQPTQEELNSQRPVKTENHPVIRGDGLQASSIQRLGD